MEKIFNTLSESLFRKIQAKENLIISFSGENSQFIRFNNATIRQTGLVDDAEIMLKFIANLFQVAPYPCMDTFSENQQKIWMT